MNRRSVIIALCAASLAACAPLPNTNPISRDVRASLTFSSIEVNTSGTAFESTRAADYTSRLSGDIRGLLEREFVDRMNSGGVKMIVDVARINVAGATTTAFGRDQSLLQGSVRVVGLDDAVLGTYAIQVVAGGAANTTTGALVDSAIHSGDGYYRDLVGGFARDVREQILGGDWPGQRLIRQVSN
jgi:type IV pilus biogenesis protein CpaD/CtpE